MGLIFVMSSKGSQVKQLISDFPHVIPMSCFYGDESRKTFKFAKAHYSVWRTLSFAGLPQYTLQSAGITMMGLYNAFTMQKYKGDNTPDWQMGATLLLDDEKTYFR